MKKAFVGMVAAAGLLGVIGATVIANAGTNITSPETITTVGKVVKERGFDVGKKGETIGDTYSWTLDIKSTTGVDLGTQRILCISGTDRWAICTGTYVITGRGEIVGTGLVNFATTRVGTDLDVPITGGTGEFANVRGVSHIHVTEEGETDTLELLP